MFHKSELGKTTAVRLVPTPTGVQNNKTISTRTSGENAAHANDSKSDDDDDVSVGWMRNGGAVGLSFTSGVLLCNSCENTYVPHADGQTNPELGS